MPKVFDQLQDAERTRIVGLKQLFLDAASAELSKQPIISRCVQGMLDAANKIEVEQVRNDFFICAHTKRCTLKTKNKFFGQDFGLLVELHKTGYTPPCDFPFLDMSSNSSGGSGITLNRSNTLMGNNSMTTLSSSNGSSLHHHAHQHHSGGQGADNTDSGSGSGLNVRAAD